MCRGVVLVSLKIIKFITYMYIRLHKRLDYIRLGFQRVDFECRVFSSEDCWGPTCRSCLDCWEYNISPGNHHDSDTFTTWHSPTCQQHTMLLKSSMYFSVDLNWPLLDCKEYKWMKDEIKSNVNAQFYGDDKAACDTEWAALVVSSLGLCAEFVSHL